MQCKNLIVMLYYAKLIINKAVATSLSNSIAVSLEICSTLTCSWDDKIAAEYRAGSSHFSELAAIKDVGLEDSNCSQFSRASGDK